MVFSLFSPSFMPEKCLDLRQIQTFSEWAEPSEVLTCAGMP